MFSLDPVIILCDLAKNHDSQLGKDLRIDDLSKLVKKIESEKFSTYKTTERRGKPLYIKLSSVGSAEAIKK